MDKLYKDEAANKSGVYKITNKLNGKFYIGSCKRFKQRCLEHEKRLRNKKHSNRYLQNVFNKHGSNIFVFEVIEVIEGDKKLRLDAEQKLLDLYYDGGKQCYNLSKWAQAPKDGFISRTPEETRKKLSEALKKYWVEKKKRVQS